MHHLYGNQFIYFYCKHNIWEFIYQEQITSENSQQEEPMKQDSDNDKPNIKMDSTFLVNSPDSNTNDVGKPEAVGVVSTDLRRVWRHQMGNQNPYIEEEQAIQWSKEKVRKDKQRSTKHYI